MRVRKYVIARLDGLAVQIPGCFRAQYKEIGVNVTSCVPLATTLWVFITCSPLNAKLLRSLYMG